MPQLIKIREIQDRKIDVFCGYGDAINWANKYPQIPEGSKISKDFSYLISRELFKIKDIKHGQN